MKKIFQIVIAICFIAALTGCVGLNKNFNQSSNDANRNYISGDMSPAATVTPVMSSTLPTVNDCNNVDRDRDKGHNDRDKGHNNDKDHNDKGHSNDKGHNNK